MVEFAILLPIFMTLILGMFSGGLAYNRQMALRQATREGARYGATLSRGTAFAAGETWATTVRSVMKERSEGELTDANICVALVSGSGASTAVVTNGALGASWYSTTGAPCYNDGGADGKRRVQVTATSSANIEALFFSRTLTLDAESTARHEAG